RGNADVALGGEGEEVVAGVGREREAADELVQDFLAERTAAGQVLELFVGVGQAVFAHDHLNGFAQDFPDFGEVAFGRSRVEREPAEAAARGFDGDESLRSRCKRETGNFSAKCWSSAMAIPQLASEFSKLIGLTLCGIVDEPT